MKYKTKISGKEKYNPEHQDSPKDMPKVYFSCHKDDFEKYFDSVTDEILKIRNCAIYFYDTSERTSDNEREDELREMLLFVFPITVNFLKDKNSRCRKDFDFAVRNNIPKLLIQQESDIEEYFNFECGNYQMLSRFAKGPEEISYEKKLQTFLDDVIVGDELKEKINEAFDAKLFLSYRKNDRRHANELMRRIHNHEFCRDIAIWYDEFLVSGEIFDDSIMEALEESNLFVMSVTPNLVNEENYIHEIEYPKAEELGKEIFPVETVRTDKRLLEKQYGITEEETVSLYSDDFSDELKNVIDKIEKKGNEKNPRHNYLIGLAYLNGINVEINRELGLELIRSAADADLPEAVEKILNIYKNDIGTEQKDYLKYIDKYVKILEEKFNKEKTFENAYNLIEQKCVLPDDLSYDDSLKRLIDADVYLSNILTVLSDLDQFRISAYIYNQFSMMYSTHNKYSDAIQSYETALSMYENIPACSEFLNNSTSGENYKVRLEDREVVTECLSTVINALSQFIPFLLYFDTALREPTADRNDLIKEILDLFPFFESQIESCIKLIEALDEDTLSINNIFITSFYSDAADIYHFFANYKSKENPRSLFEKALTFARRSINTMNQDTANAYPLSVVENNFRAFNILNIYSNIFNEKEKYADECKDYYDVAIGTMKKLYKKSNNDFYAHLLGLYYLKTAKLYYQMYAAYDNKIFIKKALRELEKAVKVLSKHKSSSKCFALLTECQKLLQKYESLAK